MSPNAMSRMLASMVLAASILTLPAIAQRKPEPPAAPPAEAPKVGPSEEFLAAYKQMGRPRLAIGVAAADRGVDNGDLRSLEARLIAQFRHPQVTLVDLDTTNLRQDNQFQVLLANDEKAAAAMLARETNADVAVLVKLDGNNATTRSLYRATYLVLDANRAEQLDAWSFDIQLKGRELTQGRIGQYADALGRRITENLGEYGKAGSTKRYTVRICDLSDTQAINLFELLEHTPGVEPGINPQFASDMGRSMVKFDLNFDGNNFRMLVAAKRALSAVSGDPVMVFESRRGFVTLAIDRPPPPPAEPQVDETARFKAAYAGESRPRIALMINAAPPDESNPHRGVADESVKEWTFDSDGAGVKMVGRQVKISPLHFAVREGPGREGASDRAPARPQIDLTDDQILNTREIEDLMNQGFSDLGVRMVELTNAWMQLDKEKNVQEKVFGELELAQLLAAKDSADVLISGIGRVVHLRGKTELRYTFRAYNVKDSIIIGTSTQIREIAGGSAPDLATIFADVAGSAVKELAYRMMLQWEPPSVITVEVSGLKSDSQLLETAQWMEKNIDGVATTIDREFKGGGANGSGSFDLVYREDFRSLREALSAKLASAPFALDDQDVSRKLIRLRAGGGSTSAPAGG